MSIANNHLSKHGRFGDTEIAKTSNGDLWHVSKHEKKLIDNYGKIGEDVVDRLGSGTINLDCHYIKELNKQKWKEIIVLLNLD